MEWLIVLILVLGGYNAIRLIAQHRENMAEIKKDRK